MGLLDFLSDQEDSEDEVARFVAAEYGCADWAVRNAISAALEAKLAKRRHELSIVFEIPRLFTAPVGLGGHRFQALLADTTLTASWSAPGTVGSGVKKAPGSTSGAWISSLVRTTR
jgi:hypothetical protein